MIELKDVKCERCGRVIGKRRGSVFVSENFEIEFRKSERIKCTNEDCGRKFLFKVSKPNIFIDKQFAIV